MKTQRIFFILFILSLTYSGIAQSVPQGMKYQAVARDNSGQILNNEEINLEISLTTIRENQIKYFYTENHNLQTDDFGLFEITIGQGDLLEGSFSEIPWSTKEIWLQISLFDKELDQFDLVSSNRLFAVPYAFHAGSANDLVFENNDHNRTPCEDGVKANVWSLQGNCETDPEEDKLGTTDCQDLVIITDNQERLRITCAGNIDIDANLTVNQDLYIGSNLDVENNVDIGNNLNIINNTTTNSLDVATNTITSSLTVNNNTTTNLLNVVENADIGVNLNVGNTTNTEELIVNGHTNTNSLEVNDDVNVGMNLTVGETTTTEDLIVNNNLDVNNELLVLGDATFEGAINVNAPSSFVNLTVTDNTNTGSLTVNDGATVGANLNVADNIFVDGYVNVNSFVKASDAFITSDVTVGQNLAVTNNITSKYLNVSDQINADIVSATNLYASNNISSKYINISDLATVNAINVTNDINANNLIANQDLTIGNNTTTKTLNVSEMATLSELQVTHDINTKNLTATNNVAANSLNISGIAETMGLQVNQNATIGNNLTVTNTIFGTDLVLTNNATIPGDLDVGNLITPSLYLGEGTPSTDCSTGDLVTNGGVGIGQNLNVCGLTHLEQTLLVDEYATFQDQATFNGEIFANKQVSILKELTVHDHAQFNDDITVDGSMNLNGFNINSSINGPEGLFSSYPVQITSPNHGLAIKSNGTAANAKNYISFWDSNYGMRGRIEGQTQAEVGSSFSFIWENILFTLDVALLVAEGIACGVQLDAGEVIVMAASGIALGIEWDEYVVTTLAESGVAYESGNGDYAEWLERIDPSIDLNFGEIVGVVGGKISRNTENADHYMVISKAPIVLGNMPEKGREQDFEKVAFMGQVPVRVIGKVMVGDYILPSGNNDGLAISKSSHQMEITDFEKVVGVAWEASKSDMGGIIKMAVGLNSNDMASKVAAQEKEIQDIKSQLENIIEYMAGGAIGDLVLTDTKSNSNTGEISSQSIENQATLTQNQEDGLIEITDEWLDKYGYIFEEQFENMRNKLADNGVTPDMYPEELKSICQNPVQAVKDLRDGKLMPTLWKQLQKNRGIRKG